MLLSVSCSIPVDIPSLMLPRIAKGPITKIRDEVTKPSTNGDSPFLSNEFLSFIAMDSKRSSILNSEPRTPPISREARTIRMGEPWGTLAIKSLFQRALIDPAAPINVIAPSTSVMRMRVFSLILLPRIMPITDPAMIDTIFITVPTPINIDSV